jgi:hypothetical protein
MEEQYPCPKRIDGKWEKDGTNLLILDKQEVSREIAPRKNGSLSAQINAAII